MKQPYPQMPSISHRCYKDLPIVCVRTKPSLLLEFNSFATDVVAKQRKINLQARKKYGVELQFEPKTPRILVEFLRVPYCGDYNPNKANMTIMSDLRDQFSICCAQFLRQPRVSSFMGYLATCELDFGVVSTIDRYNISISFNLQQLFEIRSAFGTEYRRDLSSSYLEIQNKIRQVRQKYMKLALQHA